MGLYMQNYSQVFGGPLSSLQRFDASSANYFKILNDSKQHHNADDILLGPISFF